MAILPFGGASNREDKAQIGILIGVLIGTLSSCSVFHTLTWLSKHSRRPIKSVESAEVPRTTIAADEGSLPKSAYFKIIGVNSELSVIVDTKDLYKTISTKRLPTHK